MQNLKDYEKNNASWFHNSRYHNINLRTCTIYRSFRFFIRMDSKFYTDDVRIDVYRNFKI
ncbi:hypothetical protein GCM10011518_27280 [Flavobacterium limi]|uniref:Uncharacterized protein n=1 Tax=Flavobacterium limi TaxID=2045105 RepID=A0ABQ1UDE5_9FLAO|nr:hypothetical protein GCM10011518_27280 [Flavobacterium limi]